MDHFTIVTDLSELDDNAFFSLMFFGEYHIFSFISLHVSSPHNLFITEYSCQLKNGKLIFFFSVAQAWCSCGEFVFKQLLLIIQFCLYICHVKEMWGLNVDLSTPDLRISSLRISSKLGSKLGFHQMLSLWYHKCLWTLSSSEFCKVVKMLSPIQSCRADWDTDRWMNSKNKTPPGPPEQVWAPVV